MTFYKPVLKATVGLQSVAILGRALSLVPKPKEIVQKPSKVIRRAPMKMMRGFTDIIVGTALIGPTAKMVNALD